MNIKNFHFRFFLKSYNSYLTVKESLKTFNIIVTYRKAQNEYPFFLLFPFSIMSKCTFVLVFLIYNGLYLFIYTKFYIILVFIFYSVLAITLT